MAWRFTIDQTFLDLRKEYPRRPGAGFQGEVTNHEWTRIHTNLRHGFASTDYGDWDALL